MTEQTSFSSFCCTPPSGDHLSKQTQNFPLHLCWITPLAFGILSGIIYVQAAYYLNGSLSSNTFIYGSLTAAAIALSSAVALCCIFNRKPAQPAQNESKKESSISGPPSDLGQIKETKLEAYNFSAINERKQSKQPTQDRFKGSSTSDPTSDVSEIKETKLEALDSSTKVNELKQPEPEKRYSLSILDLREIFELIENARFSQEMKKQGMRFYDPTNELEIPLIRLYQDLLLWPGSGSKTEILLQLFADELLNIFDPNDKRAVNRYIKYFDCAILMRLFLKISEKTDKGRALRNYLDEYSTIEKKSVALRNEIERQLDERVGKRQWYVGSSLGDGGCFFHTCAEILSVLLKKTITEKTLRLQCYHYMQKLESIEKRKVTPYGLTVKTTWTASAFYSSNVALIDYFGVIEEGQWSSKDILDKKEKVPDYPTWGWSSIHGKIIAELYNVTIDLYEADFDETKTIIQGDGTRHKPYDGEEKITLSQLNYPNSTLAGESLRVGAMGDHFFPIWVHSQTPSYMRKVPEIN